MQKYINLILKDIIAYKKILFFPFYFQIIILFTPISPIFSFLFPIMLGLYCFLVMYVMEEEKNKGTELLITTVYNRKDIVISRYLLCTFIIIFQIIFYFLIMFIKLKEFPSIDILQICFNYFIVCLFLSLFLPFSFYFKAKTLPIFVTIISMILSPLVIIVDTIGIKNIYLLNNSSITFILTFLLSLLFIFLSVTFSKKIYKIQDL